MGRRRETPSSKKWEAYKDGKKQKKHCMKCGPGIFLADHEDRLTCGRCGYTEMK